METLWAINYLTPNCHRDCNGHIVLVPTYEAGVREALKRFATGEYVSCDILSPLGESHGPFCDPKDIQHAAYQLEGF